MVAGDGLVSMFRDLGAQAVVTGGQTMNPSTQDLLNAIDAVPAETVILLPNNKNIVPVARQAAELTVKRVLVVPTTSVPQGLAAMVAYLPGETDALALSEAMAAAAGDVSTGEITRATREATTPAGPVQRGDWLGLLNGEIRVAGEEAGAAMTRLLDALVEDGSELVTIVTGKGADPETTEVAETWLSEHRPGVHVEVTSGDQPLYPYLISVE